MRKLSLLLAAGLVLTLAGGPIAHAQFVPTAPPPPQFEPPPPPPPPGAAMAWRAGYWQWNGHRYVWRAGHYVRGPRPGAVWIAGHWRQSPRGWRWINGHWG